MVGTLQAAAAEAEAVVEEEDDEEEDEEGKEGQKERGGCVCAEARPSKVV